MELHQSFFCYYTYYRFEICILYRLCCIVNAIPKEGLVRPPPGQTFFWYENNRDLKRFFAALDSSSVLHTNHIPLSCFLTLLYHAFWYFKCTKNMDKQKFPFQKRSMLSACYPYILACQNSQPQKDVGLLWLCLLSLYFCQISQKKGCEAVMTSLYWRIWYRNCIELPNFAQL